MYCTARHEICRFAHEDLLYRVYLFENGEIAFTVTANSIRLGLLSKEDLHWDWFWDLPEDQETSRQVNVHAAPVKVLRTIALRLAQYIASHQPAFFFYSLQQPRLQRIYQGLLRRHPEVASQYDSQLCNEGEVSYVVFTRKYLPNPNT